ncbi:RNA polymerase II transcription factor SIII subunit A-domain-containing protein [Mycena floridula]|nr:RNA polymerase II transcription factor SIII subunit A-domain-containing protein [Mycena floridula]
MSVDKNITFPSLVHFCQRVLPILERCTVEQLLRLEQASPHLQNSTQEIWKKQCYRKYPALAHPGEMTEPHSWRAHYFALHEEEEKRIEQVGKRLRIQRQEADERKKESAVKYTDRISTTKRSTSRWGQPVPPKTLFQKTRTEASKIQRNVVSNARMMVPMPPNGKDYRSKLKPSVELLPPPPPNLPSRVTVTPVVIQRRSMALSSSTSTSTSTSTSSSSKSASRFSDPPSDSPEKSSHVKPILPVKRPYSPSALPDDRAAKSPRTSNKKDPMSLLFLPKHRAHSQVSRKPVTLQ